MKHKHYDVIVAWAEGKEIQHIWHGKWHDWDTSNTPGFYEECEYRIKPEPKPDVVREVFMTSSTTSWCYTNPNLRLTFDGETGKLKQAEVIDGST